MSFGVEGTRVMQLIDPYKGPRYTEFIEENMDENMVDHIYKLTMGTRDEYVYPTIYGALNWCSIYSFNTKLEDVLQNWQEHNYELSFKHCASINYVIWIRNKLREPYIYDRNNTVEYFLVQMEHSIEPKKRIPTLDVVPKSTTIG
jgi:hypothetical protein